MTEEEARPVGAGRQRIPQRSASCRGADRSRQPWTLFARSLWHAPDRDGKMEVQLLPGQLQPGHKWPRQQSITALQAPDVTTEMQVAVDRVLLALLDSGFSNLLRVGSLQRIAKRLLAHSLHSGDDSRDALGQLQGMLADAAGAEAEMIRSEIAQLQAGAERQRRKRLSTAAVVGVTCCAALQSTLEGQAFDVLLLDESSQMTEPTSLVPLLRAKPSQYCSSVHRAYELLLATQQTTCVEATSCLITGVKRICSSSVTRCHPTLSMLSNRHFYNSMLINGVSGEQRSAIVPGLPPLLGVICFFRGQANLIRQMLAAESCRGAAVVQVATVDSFQARDATRHAAAKEGRVCMEVGVMRHLVVVGAAEVLSQAPSPVLRDLVKACRAGTGGSSYAPGSSLLALPALSAACMQQECDAAAVAAARAV
ncbi:hypothetical protein COO60DRAFT_1464094 [Scenedesmus sp. NREL 46B-D3]|nr:hypothetical protein COO60DRAFT_1464094 [Scenedesmus sp. NREL 46B-D3]